MYNRAILQQPSIREMDPTLQLPIYLHQALSAYSLFLYMDGFYVFLHQLFFIICRTRYISIVHYKMPKRSNPRKLSFDTLNAPERIFSFGSNYFSLYAKEHRIVSCFYLAPLMLTSSSSVQHVLFSLLLVSCFFLCLVMSPSTVTW